MITAVSSDAERLNWDQENQSIMETGRRKITKQTTNRQREKVTHSLTRSYSLPESFASKLPIF